jgi:hypothetical protein
MAAELPFRKEESETTGAASKIMVTGSKFKAES